MQTEHPKEQVLVISTHLAAALSNCKVYGPAAAVTEQIILSNHTFRDREEAETNFDFKQVIPYVLVVYSGTTVVTNAGAASLEAQWLLSQRTKKQQETRLHDKYSIGQGGHINELDTVGGRSPIMNGLLREIAEEFKLDEIKDCAPVGIINDDSNEVGKVHFGLVYMVRVASMRMEVAEKGKHVAQWATVDKLKAHYADMENWSKIVMDHILVPA